MIGTSNTNKIQIFFRSNLSVSNMQNMGIQRIIMLKKTIPNSNKITITSIIIFKTNNLDRFL